MNSKPSPCASSHTEALHRAPTPLHHFRMEWSGGQTPAGATLGGKPVCKLHLKRILGPDNELLGHFIRSSPKQGEHAILISTHYTEATPPTDGIVTPMSEQAWSKASFVAIR